MANYNWKNKGDKGKMVEDKFEKEIQNTAIKWIKIILYSIFLFFFIIFIGFLMGIVEFFKALWKEGKKAIDKIMEMVKDE